MFRRNLLMVHADRDGLRRLQEALGAIGEFLEVHAVPFIVHRSDSVALMQHKPIRPISSCRIYSGIQPSTSVRSEEHTSELQSLMRISYAVFCLKKKNNNQP